VSQRLRVVVADDERPARAFLLSLLAGYRDVDVVGEAMTGTDAVELIERVRPDLALLDLQMPELDGLGVVRMLRRDRTPLVAFVTAHDEFAVRAFELNAVDYLLKPVQPARLRETIDRAAGRLEQAELGSGDAERVRAAATIYAELSPAPLLRRIPVRRRDDIVLVPVDQVTSVVADGELLRIATRTGERHVIAHRLKDLEERLDPTEFVRISRGTLIRTEMIERITPLPGGTFVVTLRGGAEHTVSRIRGRMLRDQLLKL
jgi:two-component system LytT family response regulator